MTIKHDIKRQLGQKRGQTISSGNIFGAWPSCPKNWLFLGVGYTAKALIDSLPQGLNLMGTSRDPNKWTEPLKQRVKGVKFKGEIGPELKAALTQAEIIIISLPPNSDGDPFLSALASRGAKLDLKSLAPNIGWVGYLSATSVYGDRGGQWAFEDELLKPQTQRGYNRVMAELGWLETGLPVHIFRLAGIYGGEYFGQARNPFARLRSGKARSVIKPGHIVNRIHAKDIAGALWASMQAPNPMQVYNIADGRPAPPQDVLDFAARLIGAPLPPRIGLDSPDISQMARSFYTETKSISNRRAQSELSWLPALENYQIGLMSIYKQSLSMDEAVMLAGYLDIPPNHRRAVNQALPRHIKLTRQEKGCVRFDIVADPQTPERLHVVEIFENQAAFDHHQSRTSASDWAEISRNITRHYHII